MILPMILIKVVMDVMVSTRDMGSQTKMLEAYSDKVYAPIENPQIPPEYVPLRRSTRGRRYANSNDYVVYIGEDYRKSMTYLTT